MPRSTGATLLEVLVAIFVMGIGMLALLTLFPIGALRMAKAIQDERCAQTGASGQSMSIFTNIRNEPALFNPSDAYLNPANPKIGGVNDATTVPGGPSYPVFI